VATGAPWCTLCYADLRPQPSEPVVAAAPSAESAPPASGGRHRASGHAHRTPSSTPLLPATPVDVLDPELDRPVVTHTDAVRGPATWPCLTCGELVAIAKSACTHCGAAFLSGGGPEASLALPGIGDPRSLSIGAKVGIIAGGALGLMLLLLIFTAIVGQFL
jgi:hypothetical protein